MPQRDHGLLAFAFAERLVQWIALRRWRAFVHKHSSFANRSALALASLGLRWAETNQVCDDERHSTERQEADRYGDRAAGIAGEIHARSNV
jgi:hypothetical protein